MKSVPSGLAAHLAGGATTLATCWKATRGDGAILGFTDHDADIVFDGVVFTADSGPVAAQVASGPGLAVGGGEIAGALNETALSSQLLSAADLAAGLWDRARVEVWRVNWADPAQRLLLRVGEIGEVTRADGAFRAELRALAQALDAVRGRVFGHACDADLGDARCGVDLDDPQFFGEGTVVQVDGERRFAASGLEAFAADWFAGGLLLWTGGANAGRRVEVAGHDGGALELWLAMAGDLAVGDTFRVTAGCDKRAATCRAKFDNFLNFRGFPHMPGNDFALSYPDRDTAANDGGALVE